MPGSSGMLAVSVLACRFVGTTAEGHDTAEGPFNVLPLVLLLQVGLSDKLTSLAGELSGGQRRKLSVAIAFLGNPAGAWRHI
jgi:predicted ABC-type transport system involved in lysophospholipase L1 biosynthesis ATPase subunit